MSSQIRTVETTGQDIEQAIEAGLNILDVNRESVIVEILDEPSRGLLGIGARQARVRLKTTVPPRSEREAFEPSGRPAAKPEKKPEEEAPKPVPAREEMPDIGEEELDDEVRIGAATLREILQNMDVESNITIERAVGEDDSDPEENPWILHIRGDDLGFLIGRRGETLSALQYLARLIASRDLQRRADFIVDIENYKARREVLLRKLALRMANEALKRRRTVELEPMPPHERRIIHMALRNHDKVYTESKGDGNRRRVTVIPKRN
jgi:spoIIIJ-associated protein